MGLGCHHAQLEEQILRRLDFLAALAANASDEPLRQGAIGLILAVVVMLVVMVRIGERRWHALGLDIDGKRPPED